MSHLKRATCLFVMYTEYRVHEILRTLKGAFSNTMQIISDVFLNYILLHGALTRRGSTRVLRL